MSLSSTADAGFAPPPPATPPRATRPFYWSVRRELWENRSIWVAPLVVAGVVLISFPFSLGGGFPARFVESSKQGSERAAHLHAIPYDLAAMAIILASLAVAVTYCLGALQGERRDRSILFWKSLPVSDFTTVLAKAAIPLAALPAVAFGLVVVTQLAMEVLSTLVLAAGGVDPGPLWTAVPPLSMAVTLLYALVAIALWNAPIYAWLLLVSAWARRMAFLWAFGPVFLLAIFDRIVFQGLLFDALLKYRLIGGLQAAFKPHSANPMGLDDLDPLGYLATPGLWAGLAVAAAFLAAAVWLRRRRSPD